MSTREQRSAADRPHTFESHRATPTLCEHCGFTEGKPWHVPNTYMASGEHVIEDCLLCGAETPTSHVVVSNTVWGRAGRVCASHTLREVIQHSADGERQLFSLTVEVDPA